MIQPLIRPSRRGYAWLITGYLCGYVALDWVSYLYSVAPPLAITPWNPPPGLSIALLLRTGLGNAPWLFVAAFAAELLVRGPHLPLPLLVVTSMLPTLVYTLFAAMLRGPFRFDPDFTSLRDAAIFVATTTVVTGLLAVSFVGVLALAAILPAVSFAKGVAQYWIGDLIGIVVTTPLLLVFTRARVPRLRVPLPEAVMQVCLVIATLWAVFGSGWFEELKLFYILFLPVMWIAMRHGIEGTTIATVVIQIGLIVAMRLGDYGAGAVVEFQFLLLAVAVTGLFLGLTVSERREIALQLRDKQFELDRSLRLAGASEMASALAHELNQPLSAIGSYVRACQVMIGGEQEAPTALKDTMDKVVVEVTRAGNVVRQLRDFFRTGSGRIASVGVRELLQSALDTAHPRFERHRVAWRLDCPASLPAVLVDRIQVETVLHNLISNAIDAMKSSTDGRREIVLSAAVDGPNFVRIGVADTGPGIPDQIAAQLFRPFATSKPGGMGLGLAISRSIVEACGGRLWLQVIEQGSMFCFTVPTSGTTP
jgi:two-component system sensor kinase FixL